MVATITVLYPTGADTEFNMDYYLSKHMKIVEDNWKSMGLQSWRITKLADPKDTSNPYCTEAYLEFSSLGDFQKAVDASGSVVLGDIPNFCNKQPIIAAGEVIGQKAY